MVDPFSPQGRFEERRRDAEQQRALKRIEAKRKAFAPCRAIRQSDEVYCPDCALRWSLNESRPECPKQNATKR